MAVDEVRSGMGSIGFWGNTPACDLLELTSKFYNSGLKMEEILHEWNILLVGQADFRHVLKTLATYAEGADMLGRKEFHIHFLEGSPILYARQLLLMHLAFLPKDVIGIHEKTTQFMEIFGNLLIRPQTRKTIRKCAETLIKVMTDECFKSKVLPMVNLDGLKHRERDILAEIFKFWAESSMSSGEIQTLWDSRLRHCLQSRYDTRMGVFDWDYQMRMTEKNSDTKIVNISEYKKWRKCGLAFTEYENDYNQANITFLAGKNRSYQGDMLLGPFLPYGIQSDDASFFEKANNEFKKKSQDVTFHTLYSILDTISSCRNSNIRIHFLPFDTSINLWRKSKFIGKFDFLLVSNLIGHQITPELIKLVSKDGVVIVDKTKYVWYFREENDKAYEHKVLELANLASLVLDDVSSEKDNYLIFKLQPEQSVTEDLGKEDHKENGDGDRGN